MGDPPDDDVLNDILADPETLRRAFSETGWTQPSAPTDPDDLIEIVETQPPVEYRGTVNLTIVFPDGSVSEGLGRRDIQERVMRVLEGDQGWDLPTVALGTLRVWMAKTGRD